MTRSVASTLPWSTCGGPWSFMHFVLALEFECIFRCMLKRPPRYDPVRGFNPTVVYLWRPLLFHILLFLHWNSIACGGLVQLFGVAWSPCCLAHAVVPSQCDTVATPRPDWLEGSALSGLTGPGRVPVATSSRWQSLLHPLGGKTAGAVTAIGCGAVATESGGAP